MWQPAFAVLIFIESEKLKGFNKNYYWQCQHSMDALGKLPFCNDKFIRDVEGGKQLSLTQLQYLSREGDGGAQMMLLYLCYTHHVT